MKNYTLLLVLFLSLVAPSYGQMTLASSLPGDSTYIMQVVNLSISGKKIAIIRGQYSLGPDTVYYYNLDYSLWKTIPCPAVPGYLGNFEFDLEELGNAVCYSSETLFNLDTLLEVAILYNNATNPEVGKILVVNETGAVIDSINNALNGTFFIHSLSSSSFIATVVTNTGPKVYNLPGTLPCDACTGSTLGTVKKDDKPVDLLSSPVPNPSSNQVKITFTLPEGASKGELTIFNTEGKMMRTYTVDNRFGFIMVDDSQFAPGMYYYNLSVNGVVSSSQKMVVIK